MQPTFTLQEVQNIVSTIIEAINHWQKTTTMATNDALSQINKFFEKKKQDLEDQQKRVTEQVAKRAKESEVKNDCEVIKEEVKKVDNTKK